MTIQDIFDTLLRDRKVRLVLNRSQADSVRVQLAKKWKKYKTELDSIGYLAADLANCSVKRTPPTAEDTCWVFTLEERQQALLEYTILEN